MCRLQARQGLRQKTLQVRSRRYLLLFMQIPPCNNIYIFLLLFPLKVFSQVNVGGLKTKVDDGSIYDVFLCVVYFHFYNTLNRLLPQRPFF